MHKRDPKTLDYIPTYLEALTVKFKKLHPEAVVPQYAKAGDAGLDLTCVELQEMEKTPSGSRVAVVRTGLAVEIPEGHVGLIFPRSSVAKKDWRLTNCVGVIDSGYRGEIKAKFDIIDGSRPQKDGGYAPGERCMQMIIMPFPYIDVEEVEELSDSDRGEGGFGSSGQ